MEIFYWLINDTQGRRVFLSLNDSDPRMDGILPDESILIDIDLEDSLYMIYIVNDLIGSNKVYELGPYDIVEVRYIISLMDFHHSPPIRYSHPDLRMIQEKLEGIDTFGSNLFTIVIGSKGIYPI